MMLFLDILIVAVFVATVGIIGLWQCLSRGAWRNYATGKALMGLLVAHALIFGLVSVGVFIPTFSSGMMAWIVLCVLLLVAKVHVAWVLWSTYKEHSKT